MVLAYGPNDKLTAPLLIGNTLSVSAGNPIEAMPMDPKQIRVAILDDNPRFRKHLRGLLGKEPDINIVAEAEPGPAGTKAVEEHKPDVILIDKDRPFTENLEITEMIVSRFPDTRIIVLQ